jgi:hypothetical protein
MKNQAQIERKNSRTKKNSQATGSLRSLRREINISKASSDGLVALGLRLNLDRIEIARLAIEPYLQFIELRPAIAQGQPSFANCNGVLGFFSKEDSLILNLDHACAIYSLDPNQIAESASRVFIKYARDQAGGAGPFAKLFEKNPGLDPENIEYLLSRRSEAADRAFSRSVAQLSALPFTGAVALAEGTLEMIKYHPGFETERAALEMICEGWNRLQ